MEPGVCELHLRRERERPAGAGLSSITFARARPLGRVSRVSDAYPDGCDRRHGFEDHVGHRLGLRDHDHVGAVEFRDPGAGALGHRAGSGPCRPPGRRWRRRPTTAGRFQASRPPRAAENASSETGRCDGGDECRRPGRRDTPAKASRACAGSMENSAARAAVPRSGYCRGTSARVQDAVLRARLCRAEGLALLGREGRHIDERLHDGRHAGGGIR